MNNRKKTILTIALTAVVSAALSLGAANVFFQKSNIPFKKLFKVISIIEDSYVEEYDSEKCEENAINAVLESLGDRYAVYYDEENAKKTMQMIEGYYVGIGTEIFANTENGYIEVMSAFDDSPAARAGIKKGDFIIAIDGKDYSASSVAAAVSYMKGIDEKNPLDKPITITVLRDGKQLNFSLKREEINMYKVKHQIFDDICYIRYSGFTEQSASELSKVVNNLDASVSGIVIDVRNNPGGEFGSAISLCDLFLDNEMIMYTVDKDGKKTVYNAKDGSCKLPLAVLVDSASASASEIFAGSMQSNGRAVIIGEKTFGKGVSQTVRYLNPFDISEGAFKLTTCKNYTPDGKWINESITPDIEIKAEKTADDIKNDAAFLAAVKILKEDK